MKPWKIEYRCIECGHELSNHERMHNYGMCRYCGYKAPTANTIVKCTEHAYRFIRYEFTFWPFSVTELREYKDDPIDNPV